ncbi:MAG: glutaredoxin domain-containing protein [Anaerolineales bacterium]
MTKKVVVYGHRFCPQVRPVKATLERSAVPYEYVDIRQNEAGRLRVMEINAGNESVPTLVFEDGSTLTEPSTKVLLDHLKVQGYELDHQMPLDRILYFFRGPSIRMLGALMVLLGLVYDALLLIVVGFILLLFSIGLGFFLK